MAYDTSDKPFMINLDVTGLYYGVKLTFDAEKPPMTVEDVMEAAENGSFDGSLVERENLIAGRPVPGLTFSKEPPNSDNQIFLKTITIDHGPETAVSRQNTARNRGEGLYSFTDDPLDAERNPIFVWQYYIMGAGVVDKNRLNGDSRKVVPFTDSADDFRLVSGDTIVWRIVGIATGPTGEPESEAELVASLKTNPYGK